MGRLTATGDPAFRWGRAATLVTSVVLGSLTASLPAHAETFVSIGSGEMDGVYYPVAQAICEVIGRELRAQDIWCSAEATPGSVYNVDAVLSGELEFGIVQSDVQFAACRGVGAWRDKEASELRSVLSLYPELVTLIARQDAGIHDIADLAGKRVNAGSQGTGTRATWDAIAAGLDQGKPSRVEELKPSETTAALCNGSIDANLLIVGHPSPVVASQLAACPSNFVAISGPAIDKLIGANPFYTKGLIPAEIYGVADFIPTFGTRATLVTSASADPRIVAALVRGIVAHVDELKALHPALAGLKVEEMVTEGLTAPLHPAAAAIYKELGLIK
jgi:uncharacterized protein